MEKVIFVDFDDTICLHKKRAPKSEFIFMQLDQACENIYVNGELNKALYDFLIDKQKTGSEIVLLTASCSKLFEIKKYWLKKFCPLLRFDDFIASSIDLSKTEIMMLYSKYKNICPQDILFIDDSHSDRWQAEEKGIKTVNPQLIMNGTI